LQADNYKSEKISELSNKYWAPATAKKHLDYNAEVIDDIYNNELTAEANVTRKKVMLLEFSQVNKFRMG
jgi:intron-binding protein aquarius